MGMLTIFSLKARPLSSYFFFGVVYLSGASARAETLMRLPWDNWDSYEVGLMEHPIVTKTGINVIIYLIGDWLSQVRSALSARAQLSSGVQLLRKMLFFCYFLHPFVLCPLVVCLPLNIQSVYSLPVHDLSVNPLYVYHVSIHPLSIHRQSCHRLSVHH